MKHSTNRFRLGLLFALSTVLIQNCANPKIKDLIPKKEIDQPYVLPAGTSLWQTQSLFSNATDARRSQNLLRIFPLFWDQAINEQFTLLWSPMPTGLRGAFWQHYEESGSVGGPRTLRYYVGAEISLLGSPLYQFQDFNLTPIFKLQGQLRVGESLALQLLASGQLELRRSDPPLHGIQQNKVSLLWQISDAVALAPFFAFTVELGTPRTGYVFSPDTPNQSIVRFPVGLHASWFALEQWKFTLDYSLFRLNYPQSFTAHDLNFGTQYYF